MYVLETNAFVIDCSLSLLAGHKLFTQHLHVSCDLPLTPTAFSAICEPVFVTLHGLMGSC